MQHHVLLFGGAFDPPHKGHQLPAATALKLLNPDELWLVPVFDHMFQKQLSPAIDRLAMCRLLAQSLDDRRVRVSSIEIDLQLNGSTYLLWQTLHRLYPYHTFSFLIGSDALPTFTQWKEWQQLLEVMQFYVYRRAGYPLEPWFKPMKELDSRQLSDISSTMVRDRIRQGQRITGLVPASVETYIRNRQLYLPPATAVGK